MPMAWHTLRSTVQCALFRRLHTVRNIRMVEHSMTKRTRAGGQDLSATLGAATDMTEDLVTTTCLPDLVGKHAVDTHYQQSGD